MKKRRITALLLALFLGSFGVHKFYLRRPGEGIFYIMANLFSRGLIGFNIAVLLGVMDAITLMMMDDRTFDRKYNWRYMKKGYEETSRTPIPRRTTSRRTSRPQTKFRRRSNAAKKAGLKYLKNYDLQEALESLHEAAQSEPRDGETFFHLASIYSLQEKTVPSLQNLQTALSLGYGKMEIHTEDKLAYLRIQPAFKRFVDNGYRYIPHPEDDKTAEEIVIKERVKQNDQ